MNNIVIINQDSGYLMIDTANALCDEGVGVTIICGRLVLRSTQLNSSVSTRKIIPYNRKSSIKRLYSWTLGFIQILFAIKIRYRNDYLFIVSNPPISVFLPLFCPNRYSFLIYDVYPDVLIKTGLISESSFIAKFWCKMNRRTYSKADKIITLTNSMSSLIQNYCGEKQVEIIPIWSGQSFFRPIPFENNPFILKYGLKNKYVVLYSGNLGATLNIEIIPKLASRVKNKEVVFLVIGNGDRKKWLSEEVQKLNLDNLILLDLQSVEMMPYSFGSADLAIISQNRLSSEMSLPSKTFDFMSAGLPLLCVADLNSELSYLVSKYNNGKCFSPDQADDIVSFIEDMSINKKLNELYKKNSLKASRNHTEDNAKTIAKTVLGF